MTHFEMAKLYQMLYNNNNKNDNNNNTNENSLFIKEINLAINIFEKIIKTMKMNVYD